MSHDLTQPFDDGKLYVLDGHALNVLRKVALRLFTENRFKNGDEMRDLAQAMELRIGDAVPWDDKQS